MTTCAVLEFVEDDLLVTGVFEPDRDRGQHAHFDVELFFEALYQIFEAFHGLLALRARLDRDDEQPCRCDRVRKMLTFSAWRINDEHVVLIFHICVL
jgi:hypothetical protein